MLSRDTLIIFNVCHLEIQMWLENRSCIQLRIICPLQRDTCKHTHVRIVAKQPRPVANNDGNVSTSAKQAKIHFQPGVQQVTQERRDLTQAM